MQHRHLLSLIFLSHCAQACVDHAHWASKWGDCSAYGPGQEYHKNCKEDGAHKGCPLSCGTCDQYGNPESIPRSAQAPMTRSEGGFDFGTGCPAGVGVPFQVALIKDETITVGIIPKGKFEVYVILKAGTLDIDIRLYDIEDTTNFDEGEAIVSWCPNTGCNYGILGLDAKEKSKNYTTKDGLIMDVTYSGYNGVGGKVGDEFIRIIGETMVDTRMEAFAFQSGTGTVEYEWGPSQTGCCTGVEACGGEFKRTMRQNDITVVGEIPVDKLNLIVTLESTVDVDVQVYDQSDTVRWANGTAIIGWCDGGYARCNYGVLNGPKKSRTVYPKAQSSEDGLEYRYSGYNGVNNKLGNEYIEILGATNRPLKMAAFAYRAGFATVKYTYFEPKKDYVEQKPKKCIGSATYYIRLSASWNSREHSFDYPYYPRIGQLIAASHHNGYTMFRDDFFAGDAMTFLARDNDIYPLRQEVAKNTHESIHESVILDGVVAGESSRDVITFSSDHPWLSAAAKVRPSPDWFLGLSDYNFCVDGQWVADREIPLQLFDAGRKGGNSFTSRSSDKKEVEVSRINPNSETATSFPTSYYGDTIPAMGTLAFARTYT